MNIPPLHKADLDAMTDTMRRYMVVVDKRMRSPLAINTVSPISAADATDDATVWALANELKAKFNLLLAALQAQN